MCKPEKPLCTPTLRRYRGIPHNTHAERERGEYYAFNTKPSKSRTNNTALRCTSSDDKPPPSRSNKTTPRFQSFETTTMKKKPSTSFGARCASSCLLLVALCVAMCALVGLAWAFRRPKDFDDAFFFFRPKGGVLQRTKKDYEGSSSSSSSSLPAGGGDDIAHPEEEEEDNDDDEENNNNNSNNRRRRKGPKGAQQNDDDVSLCDMTRWIHGKFQGILLYRPGTRARRV